MHFEIEDYLESRLERMRVSGSGKHSGEMTAVCPSCDKWGKFYVNKESGRFVCFGCEFRGRSIIGLVAQLEDISWTEAQIYVFKKSVPLRRKIPLLKLSERIKALRPRVEDEPEESLVDFELPKGFRPCFDGARWALPEYLKKRKIKSKTAAAWGMGFCRFGKYASRLIIPIECPTGRSWTARDMTGEQEPKYLNPPGADHRRLLIGWTLARLTGDLVICEGPLDAVKLWQHDISALALGGKELHDEQLAQLMELSSETAVTVMLDPEERIAPLNVASGLSAYFKNLYVAKLPLGVDPGSSTRTQAHSALEGARRWTGGRSARTAAAIESARSKALSRMEAKVQ